MADTDRGGAPPNEISRVLSAWREKEPGAREQLLRLVYEELRSLAHRYMLRERPDHVLQTTALVNEAYLRFAGIEAVQWRDRVHFFAMAATLMRRVLVDYARERDREKRGGGASVASLHDAIPAPGTSVDVLALDQALERLAALDPQQAQIVELRFFAGLSVEETAEALEISPRTVKRDWATAKAWLYAELQSRP